jgi:hypothetical protein
MSRTADKKANRAHIKAAAWAAPSFPPPPPKHVPSSWWTPAASPDARGLFIELAQIRAQGQWTNVVPMGAKGFV